MKIVVGRSRPVLSPLEFFINPFHHKYHTNTVASESVEVITLILLESLN
jgi:hypothetical protein